MAPSGSNSQPWRFLVEGGAIEVIALPEKDHPILNFHNRGTWLAIGAALENMRIAGQALGAPLTISIFPDASRPNLAARVAVEAGAVQSAEMLHDAGEWYRAIAERATNRKPYEKKPLAPAARAALKAAAAVSYGAKVYWVEDPTRIAEMGRAGAAAEIVMLENKALHKLFFHEIVWSREEEAARGGGLYIDTMEIPSAARASLRHLFSHWWLMKIFIALGVPQKIAGDNGAAYGSSALMGVIVIPRCGVADQDRAFAGAGSVMERVWLAATTLGLGFHVITGVPFLCQRFTHEGPAGFSEAHVRLVQEAYERTRAQADVPKEETIALVFRVGRAEPPSARSIKRAPVVEWR